MAGKSINQQQVKLYMKYRYKSGLTQETSAAKAGFSTRSAYLIEKGKHHTQQPKKPREYKTRISPIDTLWDNELEPMLAAKPTLQPRTLLMYLQRTYIDESGNPLYGNSIERTLQRRVSKWKAINGGSKEVMFPQQHLPGEQGLSDFTHMAKLKVTIQGASLTHMLYQFRLVFSKWSYVKVIQSGESFQALAEGLQEALQYLGGSPRTHRTDSLAAAYKNLSEDAAKDLTERYKNLCAHYHMEPTRNNKGESHENGSVESTHGHIKNRLEQELVLRGSRDFDSVKSYESWVQTIVANFNQMNSRQFEAEKKALQPLPVHPSMDYELCSYKISNLSMAVIKGLTYSVPSRLAGHTVTFHLYQHNIEGYLGNTQVMKVERQYPKQLKSRYVIDYRHIIHALVKKPRAFRFCKYRDEILPNDAYRTIWQHIDATESRDIAPKIMLRLLKLAADHNCEFALSEKITTLIKHQLPIVIEDIEREFNGNNPPLPDIQCKQHLLIDYDHHIPCLTTKTAGVSYATL